MIKPLVILFIMNKKVSPSKQTLKYPDKENEKSFCKRADKSEFDVTVYLFI